MFQCMIDTQYSFNLLTTWRDLVEDQNMKIYGHPPGLLGKNIDFNDLQSSTIIGSLSVKTKLCDNINISGLIFKNGKVKISGGLSKLECDDSMTNLEFEHILFISIIAPFLEVISEDISIKNVLIRSLSINASLKRSEAFGKVKYLEFIDKLSTKFSKDLITLPPIMQKNGKKRGRICAIKVKNDFHKKGSFAVDHSGNVQFFAYSNVQDLKAYCNQLLPIWR